MKTNKNQKKFISLILKMELELEEYYKVEIKKLFNNKLEKDVLKEIGKIMLSYTIDNNKMDLTTGEINRVYSVLGESINKKFDEEAKKQAVAIKEILISCGKDKFYSNSYILGMGMDFSIKKVKDKVLLDIINKEIEGKNYSDRLYTNKNKIALQLRSEINKFLNGDTNVNKIEKIIRYRFKVDNYITKRLVNNEIRRVQAFVNEEWNKENGMGYQMFSATLDNKTSEICSSLDGNVYKTSDNNKPIPPIDTHVGCRSCLISIPSEDWKPRSRLDNENKNIIDYVNYKNWKEEEGL